MPNIPSYLNLFFFFFYFFSSLIFTFFLISQPPQLWEPKKKKEKKEKGKSFLRLITVFIKVEFTFSNLADQSLFPT